LTFETTTLENIMKSFTLGAAMLAVTASASFADPHHNDSNHHCRAFERSSAARLHSQWICPRDESNDQSSRGHGAAKHDSNTNQGFDGAGSDNGYGGTAARY
jgi:hypothetical protein